ncbi:LOW QUALITY PROTEIN: CD63 antigen [Eleginops maclovinus]|uniref:LOW QUALITY PROTEIN: CD63 antigen n=1 Tax=Eleginops maclovinus TaxID=56733 RepID=UPI0030808E7D
MAVEGGMKCVKFLLFFFNFIFWLCGLALVVLGVLIQVNLHNSMVIKDPSASAVPIVVIIVGVIIFFIAFFGCCGAWKENHCMVTTFAILVFMIIVIEVAAAISGYVYREKLSVVVEDSLADMINNYKNSTDDFRLAVDTLQENSQCCGSNSSSDWKNFGPDENSVPDSCCVKVNKDCGVGTMTNAAIVHQTGCHDALLKLLQDNLQWVIVGALVIAALQILGIVFACCLMRGIRSGYEVM